MIFPDYKRSVVNVAASMIAAFGGAPFYKPLKELEDLFGRKKVVFLTIDGLGYEFLQKYGQGSFLQKHVTAKITSTFPATTAAAETALETGVAAQQHAITGWFVYFKEMGTVARALLFEPRWGKCNFSAAGIKYEEIFNEKKVFEKILVAYSLVLPKVIIDSYKTYDKGSLLPYSDLGGMVRQIKKAAGIPGRRFIYSYWLELDKICHKHGCKSKEARGHFWEIDHIIEGLAKHLAKMDCCLVITADHGLVDVPEKNRVVLNRDFPDIYNCLSLPLCGDTRAPYCYVRANRVAEFKKLVKDKLGYCCELRKSADFIKRGVFGLGQANPKLYDRAGDYILICKEGYLIRDYLMGEEPAKLEGFHGGMSQDEMFVPLIIVG